MLEKCLNLFRKRRDPGPGPESRADVTVRSGQVVDTRRQAGEGVTTRVLDVSAPGGRTDPDALQQRIMGRRTLYSASLGVRGYELQLKGVHPETDPELRRRYDRALLCGVREFVTDRRADGLPLFFAIGSGSLDLKELQRLPADQVVVLLRLDDGPMDPELPRQVAELSARGFRFGIDRVRALDGPARELLPRVRYLRFPVTRFDALELSRQAVAALKGGAVQLIARGVETEEDFEACRRMGFSLFEGRYMRNPGPATQRLDQDRVVVMELLNKVMSRAELSELEEGFRRDPMLSYRLLRYINSAGSGVVQEVRSIGHALFILGYDQLYRWLTLLLFTSDRLDERARGLLRAALIRARMMEILGYGRLPEGKREGLFISGVFSLLDQLLGVPMAEVTARLSLPAEVADALVHRSGVYAPYLELATACEDFDAGRIARMAEACHCGSEEVNAAHVQALKWAENVAS